MSQYMTAKLNLADGTILYPQISLDNIVASISDPTLVSVATTTDGKVPVAELPVVTVVGSTGSNDNIPTEAAVRALADTKQNTLVAGTGTEIINGSTINAMAVNLNDVVVDNVSNNGLYLQVEGNTMSVVGEFATNNTAGVLAGANTGVKLVDGVAQFDVATVAKKDGDTAGVLVDVGDGLLVAGGTASINEAPVEHVLQGGTATWTEGESGWSQAVTLADNEVDTPANLRGALSVGQAVDVSCPPNFISFNQISTDGGETWQTLTADLLAASYLSDFSVKVTTTMAPAYVHIGFSSFPKYADGLRYLYIADIKHVSGTLSYHDTYGTGTDVKRLTVTDFGATPTDSYQRIALLTSSNAVLTILGVVITSGDTYRLDIKNWRQYEVTALTDDAIAYIASLPDPDQFFRTTSVFQVRDKYLVKQDMVCPWIYTISMPDDSDLTVAAGLSYKIKYTNNNPHKITVDTIPTDAYGWDTHVQMFIKGTSSIQFQHPLILMDALTPNAGHNLIIKYRNGDALVYVDDTNAGNIVISASGTTAGTLNYCLQQDPGSGQDNYIIFGAVTDGLTCDAGTVSVNYNTDMLGNGTDKTSISGNYNVASGKTMNLQDLSVSGATFGGAGAPAFVGNVVIPSGSTVFNTSVATKFSGLTIDGVLTTSGIYIWDSSSCNINGTGTLIISGSTNRIETSACNISNITITECVIPTKTLFTHTWPYADRNITNVTIEGNTIGRFIQGTHKQYGKDLLKGCIIKNNTINYDPFYVTNAGNELYLEDCFIFNNLHPTGGNSSTLYVSWSGSLYLTNVIAVNNYFSDVKSGVGNNNGAVYISGGTYEGAGVVYGYWELSGTIGNYMVPGTSAVTKDYVCVVKANTEFICSASTVDIPGSGTYALSVSANTIVLNFGKLTIEGPFKIITPANVEATIDGIITQRMTREPALSIANASIMSYMALDSTVPVWGATNFIFRSPIGNGNTVRLSGTTFTGNAKVEHEPMRIQLPSGSTNSLQGNANADGTKILQAPVMVVGDNAAAPSGSATIINAAGTSSTVSGIGTYIDKEGDNDFTALSNITSVTTADGLGIALSDANKWTKLQNDLTTSATFTEATPASINDNIITDDYEPIFGGTYSVSSGGTMAVNEATKTTTVTDAKTTLVDVVVPRGATLRTSGGIAVVNNTRISGGGTIDMGGSENLIEFKNYSSGTITDCTFSNGYMIAAHSSGYLSISGCTVTNVNGYNGGIDISGGADGEVVSCVITGNTAQHGGAGIYRGAQGPRTPTVISGCLITGNTANFACGVYCGGDTRIIDTEIANNVVTGTGAYTGGLGILDGNTELISSYIHDNSDPSGAIYLNNTATLTISGSTTGSTQRLNLQGANTTLKFAGYNKIGKTVYGAGKVVISSGASVDLTGNTNTTPIAPGGGITFEPGGATIYPSAGSASAVTIGGGTFTAITSGGVLKGSATLIPRDGTADVSGNATLDGSGTLLRFPGTSGTISGLNIIGFGAASVIQTGTTKQPNIVFSGVTFNNNGGSGANGGLFTVNGAGSATFSNCHITSNHTTQFGGAFAFGGSVTLVFDGCDFAFNTANWGRNAIHMDAAVAGKVKITGCTFGTGQDVTGKGNVELSGTNKTLSTMWVADGYGITISSGAVLDLTGNTNATPIAPGGAITVLDGGCQVITSAGSTVSLAAGTYTKINNDGTTA